MTTSSTAPKYTLPRIIGIYSPTPQSGKDTCANLLKNYFGYENRKFATGLKDMLMVFLSGFMTEREAKEHLDGKKKDEVILTLGCTGRHLMQTLGTEWGREMVGKDIWLAGQRKALEDARFSGKRIFFSDVREENEYDLIHEFGGEVWYLVRPSESNKANCHTSNGALNHLIFGRTLVNDTTISAYIEMLCKEFGISDGPSMRQTV